MFKESPFIIDVLAFSSHKGDYELLSPTQTMKEIIPELNGYEEEVLSKMDDWPNGSTSTFPMNLVGL